MADGVRGGAPTDLCELRLPRPPQALLLDFDGVLCQSVALKADAFADLYADLGPAAVAAVRAYHSIHGGLSRVHKIRHYQQTLRGSDDEAEIARLVDRFGSLVRDKVIAAPEVPGAGALLEAARHCGVPCHVISGTPEPEMREIVERRGMAPFFSSVLGSPVRKPLHVQSLIEAGPLNPSRCLMIGDAMEDHAAAAAHGVPFLAVVPDGAENRFPDDVPARPDLRGLSDALGLQPGGDRPSRPSV